METIEGKKELPKIIFRISEEAEKLLLKTAAEARMKKNAFVKKLLFDAIGYVPTEEEVGG